MTKNILTVTKQNTDFVLFIVVYLWMMNSKNHLTVMTWQKVNFGSWLCLVIDKKQSDLAALKESERERENKNKKLFEEKCF